MAPYFGVLNKALTQPVYTDAQKASTIASLNDVFAKSNASLKQHLAGVGALDAGRYAGGVAGLEGTRAGSISNFLTQLPFNESQAFFSRMTPLLGLGMNWFGRAPVGQTTKSSGTSQGQETMYGPGFGQAFASNLGGIAGSLFGDFMNGNNPFGGGVKGSGFDMPAGAQSIPDLLAMSAGATPMPTAPVPLVPNVADSVYGGGW